MELLKEYKGCIEIALIVFLIIFFIYNYFRDKKKNKDSNSSSSLSDGNGGPTTYNSCDFSSGGDGSS